MILCECLLPLSSSLSLQQSANPSSSTSSPSLLLAVTKPPHAITHNHAQSRTITSTLSPSPLHFHFPLLLVGVPPFQLTSSSKPRQQNPWTALCSAPSSVHCIARTADTQRTSPTSPLMTAGNGEEGGVCCPLSLELSPKGNTSSFPLTSHAATTTIHPSLDLCSGWCQQGAQTSLCLCGTSIPKEALTVLVTIPRKHWCA